MAVACALRVVARQMTNVPHHDGSFNQHVGPRIGNMQLPTISAKRKIFMLPEDYLSKDEQQHGSYVPLGVRRRANNTFFDEALAIAEEEAKEVNFIDVVDIDKNDALEGYITEDLIGTLLEGLPFKIIIVTTIILNTVILGVQTDYGATRNMDGVLQVFDLMFLTIFVVEILLKWYHGFVLYWKSGWNIFDLIVVALSILGPLLPIKGGKVVKLLRGFRAFRLLRSISIIPGLQVIVGTFVQSLPDVMNILYLLFLIVVIFAVVGVTLFAGILPIYFNDVPLCILRLVVPDGWGDILNAFLETTNSHWIPAIYIVLFIIIGPFILSNAFIGVIVNNLQNVFARLSQTQKAKHRQLRAITLKPDTQKVRNVVRPEISPTTVKQQMPLEFADLSKLDIRQFENYCLILSAIEDNLAEFKQLKETLEQIIVDVKKLNEQKQARDGANETQEVQEDPDALSEPPGDIISQLIRAGGKV